MSDEISLIQTPLFGGAISMLIPTTFDDVSNFREVPDHQEVYLSGETNASMVIELMNYDDSVSDEKAASHYFHDLATDSQAVNIRLLHTENNKGPLAPNIPGNCARCAAVGFQTVTKFRAAPSSSGDLLRIVIVIIRLPTSSTDLLVTLSTPVSNIENESISNGYLQMPGEMGEQLMESLLRDPAAPVQTRNNEADIMRHCLHSLKVNDWSLFVA